MSTIIIILFIILILLMIYSLTYTIEANTTMSSFIQTAVDKNITFFNDEILSINDKLEKIKKNISNNNIPSSVFTFNNNDETQCSFSGKAPMQFFGCNIKPGIDGDKGVNGTRGIDGDKGPKGPVGPEGPAGVLTEYKSWSFL